MLKAFGRKFRHFLNTPLLEKIGDNDTGNGVGVGDQKTFVFLVKQLHFMGAPRLSFKDAGFRAYSQFEEDGILLFIFSIIGTTTAKCVEVCAGDGIECNTANLLINHRWTGLLFDGQAANVEKARQFYENNLNTKHWKPTIVQAWITKDGVNHLIEGNGFSGEVDLLSLDLDGVDYWIWKEIRCISPRVVVLEFNHLWGPDVSVTVPYADDFVAEFSQYGSDYGGASLGAFIKLGKEKGYRLVGTNAIATNAFFVRNDIACDWLPEVDPSTCFEHPRAKFGMQHRLPTVENKAWIVV